MKGNPRAFLRIASYFFTWLGILFIPFPFNLFPEHEEIASLVFGGLISFFKPLLFNDYNYKEITSDSSSLYTLAFILFILSLLLSSAVLLFRSIHLQRGIAKIGNAIIAYYLSFQLLNYGFGKIFKSQFYQPEPNILYTPIGFLDKDILFWTTIGSSYSFNIFLGLTQAITGSLLLYKRTRLIGYALSILTFTNILVINLCFDISLKFFSSFLLFLSLLGASSYYSIISTSLSKLQLPSGEDFSSNIKNQFLSFFIKTFLILIILFEVLYPTIQTGNLNDDKENRPYLHGAYLNLSMDRDSSFTWLDKTKRVFIHRMNYMIFQDDSDEMIDYKLKIDKAENLLILTDYNQYKMVLNYHYSTKDSILTLVYLNNNKSQKVKFKKLNIDTLPIFRKQFHWTIDEIE
ncbi:hypothetical protein [Sporocytophaga myxococcoides]|uniref:hypothetical protein n=1 Tax=Sporocytophaga myxococcoides TaxID=153721 RepID=UPI00040338A6|nr:hypothetical protein [Sporocytophaga myxococcoides]